MAEAVMTDARARAELAAELAAHNIAVAQPGDPPLFTRTPSSSMVPWHWRAEELAALLEKIGASLKLEAGGQRRTLRLANPGLPYGTTPTFWASIQYILPGEVATAHRHAATALRFIMRGRGSDTVVDGELYEMNEGDLVLTPSGTWHDHENKGDRPMVWLDVLDISLVRTLHAVSFEGSEAPRQPVSRVQDRSFRQFGSGIMRPPGAGHAGRASPILAYSWDRALAALEGAAGLDPDPFDDVILEYQNPLTGGPALPTLGTALQMLRPGARTRAHRHTGSVVYHAVRGAGRMRVEGQVFEWGAGDFIALPPWALHSHANDGAEPAILFQVNDIPVLQALGLHRTEEG
ncbi:cupin domain-containing protein [Roseomonas populi]|uniref:Cupin domain-containing protein n=1 Tax=Roseomonas populi TaxID=3121582 RepID=A0ABT1X9X5_9PROT|nr:cupin domain-containing protein [Roseomonas pecuniae]MCR0984914.1 cupin domain-containing protein [Roseomonas pecuniae]